MSLEAVRLMRPAHKICAIVATLTRAALIAPYYLAHSDSNLKSTIGESVSAKAAPSTQPGNDAADAISVDLSDSQLSSVKVEPAGERYFPVEKQAVGSIDFNQDMTLQVFTPYQGRIIGLFAKVGDDVTKGQTLFTIDSPDLLQAESTLIAAAGVLQFTTRK
jgi:cobalt-zinc-cadmium efflux system membrane fusion protein